MATTPDRGVLRASRTLPTALAVAALSTALVGCAPEPVGSAPLTPSVKVFTVGKEATGQSRRISGTVQASGRSVLSFGVGGQVVEVIASTGQAVAEGQLLARLDEAPFQTRIEEARAGLSKARAALVEAQATYERTKGLADQRAASQRDLDAATAALATADGNVKSSQSALEQAERDLGRTRLVAPFDGSVVEVGVDPFQEVSASGEVVLLQSDDALDVEVLVPETLIRDVDFGQRVQVSFATLEGVTVSGSVRQIGADVAAGNAFLVKIGLDATEADLRPGMTASVVFNFTSYLDDRTAHLVPLSALAIDAGLLASEGSLEQGVEERVAPLFVLDAEAGVVRLRMVEVGDLRGNEIEVFEGLEPGDLVVSAGVSFLKDGDAARRWLPRR